jgi:NitT/TauT family transport system ATP-binding protein
MLEFEDITVTFRSKAKRVAAVDHVSLAIAPGEFISLVGPSGCGKSTLLNVASGLVQPTSGQARYKGEAIKGPHRALGLVPQSDSLFPWRTTVQNITLGLTFRGMKRREAEARAVDLLAQVGLRGFEKSYPSELSGGMRQRVNIARALAIDPDVLLMDEPFGALDAFTRVELQRMLLTLVSELNKTVLFVTHDVAEAIVMSDRIVVMGARPSRIVKITDIDHDDGPRDPLRVQERPDYASTHGDIIDALYGGKDQL